jgi:hypothetical protein
VEAAIGNGYLLIAPPLPTATSVGVGAAIRASGVSRDEISVAACRTGKPRLSLRSRDGGPGRSVRLYFSTIVFD